MISLFFALMFYTIENLINYTTFNRQLSKRMTSCVHCFIQIPLAVVVLSYPDLWIEKLGFTDLSKFIINISAGYFLYDVHLCITNYKSEGILNLIHALYCCTLYQYVALLKIYQFYLVSALLWEISTPFLHLRWYFYKIRSLGTMYNINNILLVTTFFVFRIIWGTLISYWFLGELNTNKFAYILKTCVLIGNLLNYYWFSIMISKNKIKM